MEIKSATYLKSIVNLEDAPDTGNPEYAFIGRSNVGKSSLINQLTKLSFLAKTSVTPGKTRTINYFLINNAWFMVDLPGYGWAKASKGDKIKWSKMVRDYLLQRKELNNLFVLIDSRIPPQAIDIEFINWAGIHKIPLSIVFTKSDKLSNNILLKNTRTFKSFISEYWSSLPSIFITSARNGQGRLEILNFIDSINKNII